MDLQMQVRAGTLRSNSMIRKGASHWFPAAEVPGLFSYKDGWSPCCSPCSSATWERIGSTWGKRLGILKLITLGGWIWYIIDIILAVSGSLKDAQGLPLRR